MQRATGVMITGDVTNTTSVQSFPKYSTMTPGKDVATVRKDFISMLLEKVICKFMYILALRIRSFTVLTVILNEILSFFNE